LFHRLEPGLDVEDVLGDLPGDAQHFGWSPRKHVFVAPEEVDKLNFLFGAQAGTDLDGLGRVLSIDFDGFGILGSVEGVGRGGHGQAG
jgi:hypothetical protein